MPVHTSLAPTPCGQGEADLWFAENPVEVERAKTLCQECPRRRKCLEAAQERRETWGVWGGELFDRGEVVPFKRRRGRPSRSSRDSQDGR
nr:WhiB family transcriptional regulator [Pseudonocardia alni]